MSMRFPLEARFYSFSIFFLGEFLLEAAPQQKIPYFACGAYSQGGLQGIRSECNSFPKSVQAITAFVRAQVPGHPFTTVAIFQNTQTVHVDSRNAPLPNAVIAVSQFKNGQVWVGDGEGPVVRTINGTQVPGSLLPVAEHPVTFDAFRFPHCTESWDWRACCGSGFQRVLAGPTPEV